MVAWLKKAGTETGRFSAIGDQPCHLAVAAAAFSMGRIVSSCNDVLAWPRKGRQSLIWAAKRGKARVRGGSKKGLRGWPVKLAACCASASPAPEPAHRQCQRQRIASASARASALPVLKDTGQRRGTRDARHGTTTRDTGRGTTTRDTAGGQLDRPAPLALFANNTQTAADV